jgi:hypothetical protein
VFYNIGPRLQKLTRNTPFSLFVLSIRDEEEKVLTFNNRKRLDKSLHLWRKTGSASFIGYLVNSLYLKMAQVKCCGTGQYGT